MRLTPVAWSQACFKFYDMTCELRLDLHFACYLQQQVQEGRFEDRRGERRKDIGIKKQEGENSGKGEENRISERGGWDGNVSSSVWETVSNISLTLANRHLNCWVHTHTHTHTATQKPHLASVGRPPQESAATDYTWNHPWCVCLAFVNV